MRLHKKTYIMDYYLFLSHIIGTNIVLVHVCILNQITQASVYLHSAVLREFILARVSKVKLSKEILWTKSPRNCPQTTWECCQQLSKTLWRKCELWLLTFGVIMRCVWIWGRNKWLCVICNDGLIYLKNVYANLNIHSISILMITKISRSENIHCVTLLRCYSGKFE